MQSEEDDSVLMSPSELSTHLKVAERTIYQWSAQGKLPAIKIGSNWRFRRVEIDAWLEDHHTGPVYDQPLHTQRPTVMKSRWQEEQAKNEQRTILVDSCMEFIIKTLEQSASDCPPIPLDGFELAYGSEIVKESLEALVANKSMQTSGFKLNKKYKSIDGKRVTAMERSS